MGERTALRLQVKRTEPGRVFFSDVAGVVTASTLDMQYADQCEKAARGVEIKFDLAAEAFLQKLRTLVVQAPAAHVDRFDLGGRRGLDRVVVALANQKVVLDDLAEGRQRQHDLAVLGAAFETNIEDEAALFNGDVKQIDRKEHTSELQSLMRISYAVFCLKKKK